MKSSIRNAALLAAAVLFAATLPALAGDDDACFAVANARYKQWKIQPRLASNTLDVMPDGTQKHSEDVFTENMLYAQRNGIWRSGPINAKERSPVSPESVERDLQPADCRVTGHAPVDGVPATTYAYTSQAYGFTTELTLTVSDVTGLPLRAEMRNPNPIRNQASTMSASYTYDKDVIVPEHAEMADLERRNSWQHMLRNLQFSHAALPPKRGIKKKPARRAPRGLFYWKRRAAKRDPAIG